MAVTWQERIHSCWWCSCVLIPQSQWGCHILPLKGKFKTSTLDKNTQTAKCSRESLLFSLTVANSNKNPNRALWEKKTTHWCSWKCGKLLGWLWSTPGLNYWTIYCTYFTNMCMFNPCSRGTPAVCTQAPQTFLAESDGNVHLIQHEFQESRINENLNDVIYYIFTIEYR